MSLTQDSTMSSWKNTTHPSGNGQAGRVCAYVAAASSAPMAIPVGLTDWGGLGYGTESVLFGTLQVRFTYHMAVEFSALTKRYDTGVRGESSRY